MPNHRALLAVVAALVPLVAAESVAASPAVVAIEDSTILESEKVGAGPSCDSRYSCRSSCSRSMDAIQIRGLQARFTLAAGARVSACCGGTINDCVVVIQGQIGEQQYCIYIPTGPGPNPCV